MIDNESLRKILETIKEFAEYLGDREMMLDSLIEDEPEGPLKEIYKAQRIELSNTVFAYYNVTAEVLRDVRDK